MHCLRSTVADARRIMRQVRLPRGPKDNEAVHTRIEASNRGCGWAKDIEASMEQDRYLRAKGMG